jgi:RNA polymerase sigma-70 factor (ECF subfamily)
LNLKKILAMAEKPNITLLLERLRDGDSSSSDAIVSLLYEELRSIAARCLRSERRGHTLQPTALVHEAFLKLVDQKDADYRSRGHFMAIAAMVMRRILVSHAEKRAAAKRGGGAARIPLDDELGAGGERSIDLIALDEAMNKLAQLDPRKAKVVEQRFFAGIEMSHIAENLGVSLSTVKRDWEYARTWLMREIECGD